MYKWTTCTHSYRVLGRHYQRRRVAPIIRLEEGKEKGEEGQSLTRRKDEVRIPVRGMEGRSEIVRGYVFDVRRM